MESNSFNYPDRLCKMVVDEVSMTYYMKYFEKGTLTRSFALVDNEFQDIFSNNFEFEDLLSDQLTDYLEFFSFLMKEITGTSFYEISPDCDFDLYKIVEIKKY